MGNAKKVDSPFKILPIITVLCKHAPIQKLLSEIEEDMRYRAILLRQYSSELFHAVLFSLLFLVEVR